MEDRKGKHSIYGDLQAAYFEIGKWVRYLCLILLLDLVFHVLNLDYWVGAEWKDFFPNDLKDIIGTLVPGMPS